MKTFTAEKPNLLYYVTSVKFNRVPIFSEEFACQILISVLAEVRDHFPFKLIAYVIMPDHFHVIVNPIDGDISKWLLRFRGLSARRIIAYLKEAEANDWLRKLTLSSTQKRNHKFALWHKDPSIVHLFSDKFAIQKSSYIHANPTRAGLTDHPAKWKWSSYFSYLPHEDGDVAIEMDRKPYWTNEELRAVGR